MYSRMLTHGREAAQAFDAVKDGKAFDWSRHNQNAPASRTRGIAFDAAGSSGFAFLQSALELIEPKLVEPLQGVFHARDFPIKLGGGFPEQLVAWASNYASTGGGFYGLQGTANTD